MPKRQAKIGLGESDFPNTLLVLHSHFLCKSWTKNLIQGHSECQDIIIIIERVCYCTFLKKHFVFCNYSDIKEQARTLLGFFASATTVLYETAAAHVSVHHGTLSSSKLAWDEKSRISSGSAFNPLASMPRKHLY